MRIMFLVNSHRNDWTWVVPIVPKLPLIPIPGCEIDFISRCYEPPWPTPCFALICINNQIVPASVPSVLQSSSPFHHSLRNTNDHHEQCILTMPMGGRSPVRLLFSPTEHPYHCSSRFSTIGPPKFISMDTIIC